MEDYRYSSECLPALCFLLPRELTLSQIQVRTVIHSASDKLHTETRYQPLVSTPLDAIVSSLAHDRAIGAIWNRKRPDKELGATVPGTLDIHFLTVSPYKFIPSIRISVFA